MTGTTLSATRFCAYRSHPLTTTVAGAPPTTPHAAGWYLIRSDPTRSDPISYIYPSHSSPLSVSSLVAVSAAPRLSLTTTTHTPLSQFFFRFFFKPLGRRFFHLDNPWISFTLHPEVRSQFSVSSVFHQSSIRVETDQRVPLPLR